MCMSDFFWKVKDERTRWTVSKKRARKTPVSKSEQSLQVKHASRGSRGQYNAIRFLWQVKPITVTMRSAPTHEGKVVRDNRKSIWAETQNHCLWSEHALRGSRKNTAKFDSLAGLTNQHMAYGNVHHRQWWCLRLGVCGTNRRNVPHSIWALCHVDLDVIFLRGWTDVCLRVFASENILLSLHVLRQFPRYHFVQFQMINVSTIGRCLWDCSNARHSRVAQMFLRVFSRRVAQTSFTDESVDSTSKVSHDVGKLVIWRERLRHQPSVRSTERWTSRDESGTVSRQTQRSMVQQSKSKCGNGNAGWLWVFVGCWWIQTHRYSKTQWTVRKNA